MTIRLMCSVLAMAVVLSGQQAAQAGRVQRLAALEYVLAQMMAQDLDGTQAKARRAAFYLQWTLSTADQRMAGLIVDQCGREYVSLMAEARRIVGPRGEASAIPAADQTRLARLKEAHDELLLRFGDRLSKELSANGFGAITRYLVPPPQ